VSSGSNATGSTSLTLNTPAGVLASDVLVAHIVVRGSTTIITPPSGWVLIRRDNTGSSIGVALYYKVAGAAEPTSYTWTFNSSQQASGGVGAYIGVNNTTPVDASSGQYNSGATIDTAPSVTVSTANDRLLYFAGVTILSTVTPPSGMTQQWNVTTADTASEMADQPLTSAGATGNRVGTLNVSGHSNIGQLVALRP
jgi:MSHA biogenesis protein MshQ